MKQKRFSNPEFAAWVGIVGNFLLTLIKGTIGYLSNSKALIADAAHSASDILGSIAVLVGIKAAQLPPDDDHPYGHGKAETIAAIVVSVILFFVGLDIGYASIKSMFMPLKSPDSIAIYAILFSIIVKEAMFQYKFRLGTKLNNHALIANAWEHRSDVYSSLAALVGVGGAIIGRIAEMPYLYYLDPMAGLFVAGLVIRMGIQLAMESIHYTMDHVLHDEESGRLIQAVADVPGVMFVDELRAREHGHYWIVDVKISVEPSISVQEGHHIAKATKQRLLEKFPKVSDALVHVNPYVPGYSTDSLTDETKEVSSPFLH